MCGVAEAVVAGVSAAVSIATSVASAAQQASQQSEANERAAEAARNQASAKNAAANLKARQEASIETRKRAEIEMVTAQLQGKNKAELQGLSGNYLSEVFNATELNAADQQSALTVQSLFNEQNREFSGGITNAQLGNTISALPRGGSVGLTIGTSVMGGLSTGLSTGLAAKGAFDKGPTDFEKFGVPYRD